MRSVPSYNWDYRVFHNAEFAYQEGIAKQFCSPLCSTLKTKLRNDENVFVWNPFYVFDK